MLMLIFRKDSAYSFFQLAIAQPVNESMNALRADDGDKEKAIDHR